MNLETKVGVMAAIGSAIPVVLGLIAFAQGIPRPLHDRFPTCGDLTGKYWGIEMEDPRSGKYLIATADFNNRGGLKHNIEVTLKTPQTSPWPATASQEYNADPSQCSGGDLPLKNDAGDVIGTWTFSNTALVGKDGPWKDWTGKISSIP